ncbi:MAG: sialate O-acetylesterase [Planctomycetota bacterium]
MRPARIPLCALITLLLLPPVVAVAGPVKVFILSGQSNMEGKASVKTLDAVLGDPAQRDKIAHLKKDGEWVKREDVFVTYLDREETPLTPRYGPLSIGFGSPVGHRDPFTRERSRHPGVGPELGIGWVLGERFDEPVLLIKAAWGGRALKATFRPPSAMPGEAEMKERLMQAQKKTPTLTLDELAKTYGSDYRKVLSETKRVLDNIEQYVPGYNEEDGYELAGFIWFQGWNDMVGGGNPAYTEQLACFIRDMRRNLDAPGLPFVIGEMGNSGDKPNETVTGFRAQQKAVAEMPEFKGNVAYAKTASYWPSSLEMKQEWDAFRKLARANESKSEDDPTRIKPSEFYLVNWEQKYADRLKFRSDRPYHYMGSGLCYYQMGESMARAWLGLRGE